MTADRYSDAKILESWQRNASPWTTAVREGQIESRKQITDRAIVAAVVACNPRTVLDIGCGEGWLARELAAANIDVTGIDAIAELVALAQHAGGGTFQVLPYEAIADGQLKTTADVVVCNFSLIGKEAVDGLFSVLPSLLNPRGSVVVQTLHPLMACGDLPYEDGWREGSWRGFSEAFTDPAPWYFRTLERWVALFTAHGFRLREVREPLHPVTSKPASVIFIGECAAA